MRAIPSRLDVADSPAMRILTGESKGRRLSAPRGLHTRPTLARARTCLFDILNPRVPGARFLDLFAGTGAIGLEALSRGAARAVFVEQSERAARCLRRNLEALQLGERGQLLRMAVAPALARLTASGDQFDLVFLDPPYEAGQTTPALALIGEHAGLLAPDALVIAQQYHKEPVAAPNFLAELRQRRIGDTRFTFYRRSIDEASS